MGLSELWQVYDSEGNAVSGRGEPASGFDLDHGLFMANAHVWLYRSGPSGRQVLLQKRAMHLTRRPGWLHASASGHVNVGEQPLDAAIRETQEELGLDLGPADLRFVFMMQGGPRAESFNHVFVSETGPHTEFNVNKNEVDSIRWYDLSEFDNMTHEPESHALIDLGHDYFERMLSGIRSA